ncbi:hypothetical protein ATCC90586_001380 [Pythium insidiosum]|nr:hypothetical protein ATCC90586_001380 [Pythium insidiosum]
MLYYLGSQGGYREAGNAFGMSKSWAVECTSALIDVLFDAAGDFITWPSSPDAWADIETAFYDRRGFPGVVGAIDGCLFEKERPEEYEGFFCRKGYAALNAQAIVDAQGRFMSVDVRPGSWSDQKMWRQSCIGKTIRAKIPPGTHLIGDAGRGY